ncbi:phosphate ABC transporter permease subunit PstC [Cellulomonas sp. URHD0024]|uniref:phosphate ABC transporter permease subunit PstC n=1 Tax=Cellulomonas sp. URHD0024 TaxID=1302620 RepID=UPI0003FE4938|nr:phosphate ABC transporter permease subunit PstC [Cellulomonas sp. URHD0024]
MTPPVAPVRTPQKRSRTTDRGLDRGFRYLAVWSGILILAVLASVAIFLIIEALPALKNPDLASVVPWIPAGGNLWSVVGPLIFGTILAAIVSLVLAVPVAVGVALFISHYAPRRLASVLGYVVDLLAAIPSVVYGLWGVMVLAPKVQPVWQFLVDYFGWIPLFAGDANGNASNPPRVLMTTSLVLAVMILPIITAVSREVFLQTPRLHEEAALALGATRWELVRMAVLPFGRSGVTSAAMLGLGRALGETMAVLMILSPGILYSFKILVASQQQTIAGNIAAKFNDANDIGRSTLIATGLALFVITLLVNLAARAIIARNKEFSGAN